MQEVDECELARIDTCNLISVSRTRPMFSFVRCWEKRVVTLSCSHPVKISGQKFFAVNTKLLMPSRMPLNTIL